MIPGALLGLLLVIAGESIAAPSAAEKFTRGLDAYFGDQPYRAIVLVRESMTRPDATPLREPSLYVLGQCFAQIHLQEKSEDSLNALLLEFPTGRFAPMALREMARIFFGLREYGAVINLDQSYRGRVPESSVPPEFWYLVGQSHYLLGRYEQAREPLLRVGPGTSFHPFALYTMAQVEFSRNRPESALGLISAVVASPKAPSLLRDRARRMNGMILYQQRQYPESVRAYQTIAKDSPLYGVSRVDIALSAEAAGDSETARQAFSDAMDAAIDDLIRIEAKVAVGRFLNRQQRAAAARTLFQEAIQELRNREAKMRENLEADQLFRKTFSELVAFSRQGVAAPRQQRLVDDHELLRSYLMGSLGVSYERPQAQAAAKLSPETYLFPLLQSHFHNPAIIETFVSLSIEVDDLTKQMRKLEARIRNQSNKWNRNPPLAESEIPEATTEALSEMVWLLFANFDLLSRFYDALALEEKIDGKTALQQKQRALASTVEGLRLVLFGERRLPGRDSLLSMMEVAKQKIESGSIPGMMAQKVRHGFLQEWRTDRDSLTYVLENLALKERQMTGALSGVPLRSRNLNLPVLSTMTDWLAALQQLASKYRYIELEREKRPWYLAGRNEEVASVLSALVADLGILGERSIEVVRQTGRELVSKEQFRHSLVTAHAEEGIADALYGE
ncbi:MAG: tetratricopeptide repeat protein, partial [Candidatus Binatia bacterium]